jgi:hypothetical protein
MRNRPDTEETEARLRYTALQEEYQEQKVLIFILLQSKSHINRQWQPLLHTVLYGNKTPSNHIHLRVRADMIAACARGERKLSCSFVC